MSHEALSARVQQAGDVHTKAARGARWVRSKMEVAKLAMGLLARYPARQFPQLLLLPAYYHYHHTTQ